MPKSVTPNNPTSLTQTALGKRRQQATETLSKLYHGKLRLERRNNSRTIHARTYQQGKLVSKSAGETTLGAATKVATDWYLDLNQRVRSGEKLHGPLPEFPSFSGAQWSIQPSPRPFFDKDDFKKLLKTGWKRMREICRSVRKCRRLFAVAIPALNANLGKGRSMRVAGMLFVFMLCLPTNGFAHHEAIFGPQSAMVLTAERYLTAQMFTRQTGPESDRVQETTTVLSAGFSPFNKPVSFSVIVPFSFLNGATGGSRAGLEDAILSVRYRMDLPAVTRALGGRESFLMAVGGVEVPTGTLDHGFGRDAVGGIAAMLGSVEVGQFSAIGYGFYRAQGAYRGERESANVFIGGGLAWTPVDEPSGKILSLQIGMSHESMSREQEKGNSLPGTGGSGVFAHPTVLCGLSQNVLFFGQTSLPIKQNWRDESQRERYRLGTGLIVVLGR